MITKTEKNTIDFNIYPNLRLLLWDKKEKVLDEAAAFDVLDERLAKYIRPEWLEPPEKEIVLHLAYRFGGGIINGWDS